MNEFRAPMQELSFQPVICDHLDPKIVERQGSAIFFHRAQSF